jgi:hypothetical protein
LFRSENISDCGLTVLIASCPALRVLWLSGKLLKVTDTTLAALARHRGPGLARAKLTRSMGVGAALRLLAGCGALVELDARHCRGEVDEAALAALALACPKLSRVVLPLRGDGDPANSGGAPAASAAGQAARHEDEEDDEGPRRPGGARAPPACSASSAARTLLEGDVRRLQGLQGLPSLGVSH